MSTVVYRITCLVCGLTCDKTKSSFRQIPRYCSIQCANSDRKNRGDRNASKYHFDAEMHDAIRRAAHGRYGALKTLWETDTRFRAAGIPYAIVRRQAWKLGCIRSAPDAMWSEAEHDLCEQLFLQGRTYEVIVRHLQQKGYHRTVGGVASHMHATMLRRKQGDFLTIRDLASVLNVGDKVIRRWIERYDFPVHHHSGDRAYLSPRSIRRWILDHIGIVARVAVPDLVWYTALLVPQGVGDDLFEAGALESDGSWMNGETV